MKRLAPVVVDPEEREIEIVAWIREVVRIATVEADLELRSRHQLQVRVATEHIRRVVAAGVQRDHLDVDPRRLATPFLGDAVLHLAKRILLRVKAVLVTHSPQPGFEFVGDVDDVYELVSVDVLQRALVREGLGEEPVVDQILPGLLTSATPSRAQWWLPMTNPFGTRRKPSSWADAKPPSERGRTRPCPG